MLNQDSRVPSPWSHPVSDVVYVTDDVPTTFRSFLPILFLSLYLLYKVLSSWPPSRPVYHDRVDVSFSRPVGARPTRPDPGVYDPSLLTRECRDTDRY